MEIFFIKALQLVAALAFLVVIHEFGHYIFARMFGIKVEKFYLFFNPGFSLFKWKPKKKEALGGKGEEKASWRDTEYGIGWLPLGGYVKIAGMIDESMDKEQMAQPVKPWEFRAKPAWQRLLVMVAGVLFNFILAVLIYAGIAWAWGNKYVPFDKATEGMDYSEVAQAAGFQNGDIPLMADDKKLDVSESNCMYLMADAKTVTVLRKAESDSVLMTQGRELKRDTVVLPMPEQFIFQLSENNVQVMGYRLPVVVKKVQGGSAAAEAGILEGDRIVGVGGVPTPSYAELQQELTANATKKTAIAVVRGSEVVNLTATPSAEGKLGFNLASITEVYPVVFEKYSLLESFPKGWDLGTTTLSTYVSSMKHLFTAEGAKSIGGFGAIGGMFPETWNWLSFWEITAFLSVVLAFMNLIPIPGLDGGHVLFLLWEVITRRKVSEKVLEYAQMAGMIFLITLLLYANGADIVRAFL